MHGCVFHTGLPVTNKQCITSQAMQYRQAQWAIMMKFCVIDGFLSRLW